MATVEFSLWLLKWSSCLCCSCQICWTHRRFSSDSFEILVCSQILSIHICCIDFFFFSEFVRLQHRTRLRNRMENNQTFVINLNWAKLLFYTRHVVGRKCWNNLTERWVIHPQGAAVLIWMLSAGKPLELEQFEPGIRFTSSVSIKNKKNN